MVTPDRVVRAFLLKNTNSTDGPAPPPIPVGFDQATLKAIAKFVVPIPASVSTKKYVLLCLVMDQDEADAIANGSATLQPTPSSPST